MSTGTDKSMGAPPRALPLQPGARANTQAIRPAVEPALLVIEELTRKLCDQLERLEPPEKSEPPEKVEPAMPLKLRDEMRRFEAHLIIQALARTGGHQLRAARLLGLLPTTLHAKMRRYGIRPPGGEARGPGGSNR